MAAFKDLLNRSTISVLADGFVRAWPEFPHRRFLRDATTGLESLELMDRARHVAKAMSDVLPAEPRRAMELVVASLGPPLDGEEGTAGDLFTYLPLSSWLKDIGPRDVEAALKANHELTRRFTAEFSIRSLLIAHQERTLKELTRWTKSPDVHVRRLVSEGTRPRLPWAERLPAFQKDPSLALPLLEALKDDESEYVRRSVANHVNDFSKDHPQVVLDVARRWLKGATRERKRLVEHALRTLLKAGDETALELVGASGADLSVSGEVTPARVKEGDFIVVEASVKNRGTAATHVVIEAVVHFKRPSGTSTKKFRLARLDLDAGASASVSRRFRMQHRSIRQLYAGEHRVDVQANGKTKSAGAFQLSLR